MLRQHNFRTLKNVTLRVNIIGGGVDGAHLSFSHSRVFNNPSVFDLVPVDILSALLSHTRTFPKEIQFGRDGEMSRFKV